MSETCAQCGKPIAIPNPIATFDYSRYCSGFHPYSVSTNYMNISSQDLEKIRMIIREELVCIIAEQEEKLDEIFRKANREEEA